MGTAARRLDPGHNGSARVAKISGQSQNRCHSTFQKSFPLNRRLFNGFPSRRMGVTGHGCSSRMKIRCDGLCCMIC